MDLSFSWGELKHENRVRKEGRGGERSYAWVMGTGDLGLLGVWLFVWWEQREVGGGHGNRKRS